jgi:hypothetical protein
MKGEMKPPIVLLLVLVNGFIGFYCWRAYQQGMPAGRALFDLILSVVTVNLAAALGAALGKRRAARRR